mgnify:FL=1
MGGGECDLAAAVAERSGWEDCRDAESITQRIVLRATTTTSRRPLLPQRPPSHFQRAQQHPAVQLFPLAPPLGPSHE